MVLSAAESMCQTVPPHVDPPIERHGRLKTIGNRVVNQHGEDAQLRGISFSWSIWGGKKYYTPEVVDWLVDDFHVSLIRLSMAIEPDGGYLTHPQEQTALVKQLTAQAIKRGIYVIIDWHDHHADQNVEAAKIFFAEISRLYANVPNVIYEIWNEPERQNWSVIKAYAQEVIEEIRKNDASNLIIVGSPHWDQDVDTVAANPIRDHQNIAYSFHFYASAPYHQEQLRQKAEAALNGGIPLFVTEWGVGESNGDGLFDHSKNRIWMDWMEKQKLSWANWNITDKKETTALVTSGASPLGHWKADQLTPAGKYIRDQLRKLNIP